MAIVATAEAGLRAAPRATIVQLRAPGLSTRQLEFEATRLVDASRVPVVVSARCDVVLACNAAGVNLPERDIGTREARGFLGDRLVGRSVHTVAAAREAEREGADYVIFGPVWPSASHAGVEPAGVEGLTRVATAVRIQVLAIGGVTEARIADVLAARAAGYAAIRLFS